MINVMALQPGDTVEMSDGSTAEVVANPRDGMWIQVRYLTDPGNPDRVGPDRVGVEELLFAEDIVDVVS